MALQEYQRKRNFRKTTEPRGAKAAKKNKTHPLMFVVQEHHASHLHYDFRLEWEGVLKSWAVPKGPSADPGTKRLAVEVEDHPISYGSFEGVIPEGEYGAGEVFLWDTGIWTPISDPVKGFKKGHLEFELKGKRLKGHWDLIRTKIPGRQKQWLLIKRSERSLTAGTEPVEKLKPVKKKFIAFIEPELAQLVKNPPEGDEWIHELKLDGYRIQAHVDHGNVRLFTRTGEDWTEKFRPIKEALKELTVDQAVFDGEIVCLDKKGRSDFQLLQNALNNGDNNPLLYYAFDLLYYSGRDIRELTLEERRRRLKTVLQESPPEVRFSEDFTGSGRKLLQAALKHELEGIISKRRDSSYLSGRNSNWQKTKHLQRQEFVIGGYVEGTGARAPLGSLLLGVYKGEKLQFVGKVGTGFDTNSIQSILKKMNRLRRDRSPFQINSPKERKVHWIHPELVAEITFTQWTQDERLRTPVFHGLREDKPVKEILKETPENPGVISISNPDKIIYPKEKLTKMDIAEYYMAVSEHILPLLRDRPLSLLRSPDGTHRFSFFQKHLPHPLPPGIEGIAIREKSATKTYMCIHNARGLESLVQMGAFEIHCWNSRKDKVDYPDQFVMDFDPGPGVSWNQVVDAALTLRATLKKLKLESFVKTSGGKGLHVHVPIKPIYTYDQVKNFTEALAREMESREPDLYTSKMTKSLRPGKIFVDYLRNGRGSTAVSPYSLRAKAESSVALPLEWSQLKKIKSASGFTLKKTLQFLHHRKKDPWEGILDLNQRILILDQSGTKAQKLLEASR